MLDGVLTKTHERRKKVIHYCENGEQAKERQGRAWMEEGETPEQKTRR